MKKNLFYVLLCRTKKQCLAIVFISTCLPFLRASAQCSSGACTQTINSAYSSNLTVTSGQVICVVSGGTLSGQLTINSGGTVSISGGSITSSSASVSGNMIITGGTFNPNNLTLNSGGTICNGSGLTFAPSNWTFNGGTFNNYGTYAQNLDNIPSGAIFNNYSGGTLKVANNINNFNGRINNYGSADFGNGVNVGSPGVYDNFGTTLFEQNVNWNGAFTMMNEVGGTMTFNQTLTIAQNSTYNNRGKAYVNGNFQVAGGSTFNNTGRIEITGASNYDGTVNNSGFIYNKGSAGSSMVNINSGSTVHNACRFVTTTGFNNSSGNTTNDGLIWVLNGAGNNPDVQINAAFTQTVNGLLRGTSFTNNNTVAGGGNYYFTGTTLNQGTFGSGSDAPNFYDASNNPSTTNATRGFDTQNQTVAAGETHNAFVPADTTNYVNGCSTDFLGTIKVLLVTFGNVYASTANCAVTIHFETLTEQNNKAFEIENNTGGNTWYTITTIPSKGDASFAQSYLYTYAPAAAGTNYYRIKQIDKDGHNTFSSTLYVSNNCSGSPVAVTSYPNPITDYVTVSFPNTTGQKTIKIVDISGRVLQTSTTSGSIVNIPTNNLTIGIYGLEVMADGAKIYTQKLLKQ